MTDDNRGDAPDPDGTQKPVKEEGDVVGNDVRRGESAPPSISEAIDGDAAHDRSS